ncbi:hypothetical protein D3C81_1663400 [compost metagenome]
MRCADSQLIGPVSFIQQVDMCQIHCPVQRRKYRQCNDSIHSQYTANRALHDQVPDVADSRIAPCLKPGHMLDSPFFRKFKQRFRF